MTSLSCGVDALLRAAQFLEEQEQGQPTFRASVLESPQLSTGKRSVLPLCNGRAHVQCCSLIGNRMLVALFVFSSFFGNRYIIWMKLKYERSAVSVCLENRAITLHSSSFDRTLSLSLTHSLSQPPRLRLEALYNVFFSQNSKSAFVCCMNMAIAC